MIRRLLAPSLLVSLMALSGCMHQNESVSAHTFGTIRSLAFDPHTTLLASGGDDGRVVVWDLRNHKVAREFLPQGRALAWGQGLVTVDAHGNKKPAEPGSTDLLRVQLVGFVRDGTQLVSVSDQIVVYELASGAELARLPYGRTSGGAPHAGPALSADGAWLVTVREPPTPADAWQMELWDLRELRRARLVELPARPHCLAIDGTGKRIAVGLDQDVVLWEIERDPAQHALARERANVRQLLFSPDGHLLACVNDNWEVTAWETSTWRERFTGEPAEVASRFSRRWHSRRTASCWLPVSAGRSSYSTQMTVRWSREQS
jgi:WD40 repeat protein